MEKDIIKLDKIEEEQLQAAKEFLENSKEVNEGVKKLHKMYRLENTYQMCDRFTAIVLTDPIKGLELNQDKEDYFDCRPIIERKRNCKLQTAKVDVEELDKKVKEINESEFEYLVCINNTHFNPRYLLRAIKILGTQDVEVRIDVEGLAVYLKSNLGQAMVCGVKTNG